MPYIALRPFKYQSRAGDMVYAKIGDTIPEANEWKNVNKLIRRRWITQPNGQTWDGRLYKDFVKKSRKPNKTSKVSKVPKASKVPKVPKSTKVPMESSLPRVEEQPVQPVLETSPLYTKAGLNKLSTFELQDIRVKLDLQAEGTRAELMEAILKTQVSHNG